MVLRCFWLALQHAFHFGLQNISCCLSCFPDCIIPFLSCLSVAPRMRVKMLIFPRLFAITSETFPLDQFHKCLILNGFSMLMVNGLSAIFICTPCPDYFTTCLYVAVTLAFLCFLVSLFRTLLNYLTNRRPAFIRNSTNINNAVKSHAHF